MFTIKQKVFFVFGTGFMLLSASMVLINTDYFFYLFMLGIWTMILSGIIYKIYNAQTYTPKIDIAKKEQFLSNVKLLIS